MRVYDHPASSNCMKVRILLRQLGSTPFLPSPSVARSRVRQWLFFEQNQIEAGLAVARFMAKTGRDRQAPEVFADRRARGRAALESLSRGLQDGRRFLAGDDYTVADIALYAYVHCAGDAGADLLDFPAVLSWLERVEATPGFVNDLEPIPGSLAT